MAITQGVYRVASVIDYKMNLDVANGSTADGANVQLYGDNDTPAQKVSVEGSAIQTLRFGNSGKVADIANGNAVAGGNVWQYHEQTAPESHLAQEWLIMPKAGHTVTINGEALQVYSIESNKVNDIFMGIDNSVYKNTNVRLFGDDTTVFQRFLFIKDSYPSSFLPVPALVGVSPSLTGARTTEVAVTNGGTVYPCFSCAGGKFQLRYRYRTRATGTETWSDWGNWLSIRNGAEVSTDDGWGDAWDANVTVSPEDDVKHAWAVSVPFDISSYDKREMQVQVRSWDGSTYQTYFPGAHGQSATETVTIAYEPTLTFDSVALTPYGLVISYESDFPRGNNTFTLESLKVGGKPICAPFKADGLWYQGDLLIPIDELFFVPGNGAAFEAEVKFKTTDAETTATLSGAVTYDANHGLDIDIAQSPDGYNVNVTVDSENVLDEVRCIIVYDDGTTRAVGFDGFTVTPPFGKEYALVVSAVSGSEWAVESVSGLLVASSACVWDYDGGQLAVDKFKERFGGLEYSYEQEHEVLSLHGREYDSVFMGSVSSDSINITCIVDDIEPVNVLRQAGYATFRTPLGDRREVAVTNAVCSPFSESLWEVKLSMLERS